MLNELDVKNEALEEEIAPVQAEEAEAREESHESDAANEPQYTEEELNAMERGWKPKDKYKGDDWKPAKDFLEKKDLKDRLYSQTRRIKSLEKTLQNVESMMEKRVNYEREKILQDLALAKRDAIQEADIDRVEAIEREIQKARADEPKAAHQAPVAVTEWIERNKGWFNDKTIENAQMRQDATFIEDWFAKNKPEMDVEERLLQTEKEIRKKYPQHFENTRKYGAPTVETNNMPQSRPKKKYDESKITHDMRKIAKDFVRKGVFKTEDAYYDALKSLGEI